MENLVLLCKKNKVEIKLILYEQYILASFPGSYCRCNKEAILYRIQGDLERKRKRGKTRGAEYHNRLLPIFGSLSRQTMLKLCRDMAHGCQHVAGMRVR